MNPHSEMEICPTVVGSSRCDDLARVERGKGIVLAGTNPGIRSAPDSARGHRSAMTLPAAEFGMNATRAPALERRAPPRRVSILRLATHRAETVLGAPTAAR